jgi:hypothetical protein
MKEPHPATHDNCKQNNTTEKNPACHPELGTLTNFNYRDKFVSPRQF